MAADVLSIGGHSPPYLNQPDEISALCEINTAAHYEASHRMTYFAQRRH